MKEKVQVEVRDETPLRWPDGWPRTLIGERKSRSSWKKPLVEYRKAVVEEMGRLGATSVKISRSEMERLDPGVAVWFSLKQQDEFGWQSGLKLDNPAPTLAEIDKAFRSLAGNHHPDRVAQGSGGDVKVFYKLDEYRKQARAWVLGDAKQTFENCIPCDMFKEVRENLAGIRLMLSYFRGLERLGNPAILNRVMERTFKTALPAHEVEHVAVNA